VSLPLKADMRAAYHKESAKANGTAGAAGVKHEFVKPARPFAMPSSGGRKVCHVTTSH